MSFHGVTLSTCDLPDEYIDAAISFDSAERIEAPKHTVKGVLVSLVPSTWLHGTLDRVLKDNDGRNRVNHGMKLYEYDLPDEYVDAAVLSFDDSDASECENMVSSAGEMLGSIAHLSCLRCGPNFVDGLSVKRNDMSCMPLNEYDLPDEYVPAEVSCSSPQQRQRKPIEQHTRPQALDDFDRQSEKIMSFGPHIGLSRRRREYPSNASNGETPICNDLTNGLSAPQNSINDAELMADDEWIPKMKATKGETSLRKRKLSHS